MITLDLTVFLHEVFAEGVEKNDNAETLVIDEVERVNDVIYA